MSQSTNFTNQFLIAMPGLNDPNFFHSVTYICEHNEHGAMGIVINQPVNMTVGQLIDSIGVEANYSDDVTRPVYRGGPVDPDCGFVIHSPTGKWESTIKVSSKIALSTSSDIIDALAEGKGPAQYLVALGYAGWGAGQLEQEIVENAWLNGPANTEVIFNTDIKDRWSEAARLLGINFSQLSQQIGHA